MKKVLFLMVVLSLITWNQANATLYDFSLTGSSWSVSGTLTVTDNGDGSFTATSGSAIANGVPLTLYSNPAGRAESTSPLGAFYYDNQLYPNKTPLLDLDGLLFKASQAPYARTVAQTEINLFYQNGAYQYYEGYSAGNYPYYDTTQKFTSNAVPIPAAVWLLGSGLIGIVGIRRRFKN